MESRLLAICFSFVSLFCQTAYSQQGSWPISFKSHSGEVMKFYEPRIESYSANLMKIQAAVSLLKDGKSDPVFGVIWADITMQNTTGENLKWQAATITDIKFPGLTDEYELEQLSTVLERTIPEWDLSTSRKDLLANLEVSKQEARLSENLNTTPPKIIYTKKSSLLVLIDGEPQFRKHTTWGIEQVINTPFTIVKTGNRDLYLYGDKKWYSANSINGPWNYISRIPSALERMDEDVRANDTSSSTGNQYEVSEIIVSTEPAELIQSNGEANFSPIYGTQLLYVTNTANDIFMDINSQQYFVLISGRWYKSSNLSSAWTYIPSQKLPADFAKIPAGSPKDNVLANVAGTEEASQSVLEAQVPQTAKVDRNNATANVTYDGDPEFEDIEGTNLEYAVNTPGAVLRSGRRYYYVENGVWFESANANGPWMVSVQRPEQVVHIPPRYPVYHVKYVYVYDVTPEYVYMGYTPGYLGTYIYGPTIVYGTGYYYKPWRGRYYYPRATTWGFNMRYNPWTGWGFGINLSPGWFSVNIGNFRRGPSWGGWWGPPVYRPGYCGTYNSYYGNRRVVNNYTIINNRTNNIYRYRRDVVSRDRPINYDNRYRGSSGRLAVDNNRRNDRNYEARPGISRPERQGTRSSQGNGSVVRPYEPYGRERGRESIINTPEVNNPRRSSQRQPDQQVYGPSGSSQRENSQRPTRSREDRMNLPESRLPQTESPARELERREGRTLNFPQPQREATRPRGNYDRSNADRPMTGMQEGVVQPAARVPRPERQQVGTDRMPSPVHDVVRPQRERPDREINRVPDNESRRIQLPEGAARPVRRERN